MAQDEPEDSAAEAFEALRAEVVQLRAGVEGLSAAIQGQASADYAPTLGVIAQSLTAIEAHPALQIAPETLAYRLREATELSAQQGRRELGTAVQRVVTAGADLERLAAGWRTGREQVRQVAIMTADRARSPGQVERAGTHGSSNPAAKSLGCRCAADEERESSRLEAF
jgi:hypothetical protein